MKNVVKFLLAFLIGIQSNLFSQAGVGPAPYCMPLYATQPCNQNGPSNAPGNFINDFINGFNTTGAVNNIVNNNSGCNSQNFINTGVRNYFFHGCQHYLVVNPGQVITCNFQSGNTFAQGFAVFIDWNQNNIFDIPAERVVATGVPPAATWISGNFMVPAAQPIGAYRMRVRCAYFTNGTFINPCTSHGYGEVEDYMIYVGMQPPGIITATLSSNSPVCTGNTLSLTTVASGTNPNTYTYTWSGPNSFTSNVQNPTIAATSSLQSGVYTVTVNPGACPITRTIQITVNQTPTISSVTNNGPVCQGNTVNINMTTSTSGTTTFNWSGPNSYTSNVQNPTINNVLPINSGNYIVTVINSFTGNATCTSSSQTNVQIVPVATINVVPSFTQCTGTNINLSASSPSASSFLWNGPNSFTSNLSNPVLSQVTPIVSGDYTVTAFFTSQNTTLVCTSNAISNVSVVPMHPVIAFATPNVCQGGVATISATALNNPTYIWVGPNGYTSVGQSDIINNIQPFSSGNYSVTALWSIGSVSCTTSNFAIINVVPVPSISVIPNITICEGQGTAFTASAQGAISYTWSGPNGFFVTQPNTQFQNLTPNWSGQYTVNAQFTNGNINCYNSNTTDLLVKPIIHFSLSPINQLCFNQPLTINGPSGASSYTWTGPNTTSNLQNLYIQGVTKGNKGTYTLKVELNGCITESSVDVDVLDPIEWKVFPGNPTICRGESYTLTASAGNGSGNYAYNWNPYFNITGPTGSVQVFGGNGTTIYNVSVYDIACPHYTINHSFSVTVNQPPVPKLNLNEHKGCEPLCLNYNSKVDGSVSYTFNDLTYFGDSINVCLKSGTYKLVITTTGTNGCIGKFDYPNPIVVYSKPIADFTWNPSQPNTVSENIVTFNPVGQLFTNSYNWELAENKESEESNPSYKFDEVGNYPVTMIVTTEYGCKDTITKVVKVRDEFLLFIPNVFTPNGDGNNDTFKPKGLNIKTFDILIFDRWGKLIFQSNDFNRNWDGTFKGVMCQDGVYVYKILVTDNSGVRHERTGHVTLMK